MIAHYLRGRPVTPFLDLLLEGRTRRSPGSLVLPPHPLQFRPLLILLAFPTAFVVVPLRRFNVATVRAGCLTRSSIKLVTFRLDRNINRDGILLHAI